MRRSAPCAAWSASRRDRRDAGLLGAARHDDAAQRADRAGDVRAAAGAAARAGRAGGYAWLRATMGLGRAAALLAAALISAGALLLWVSYFNFAMQLAGWPLLALGLALGVAAVEELARRRLTTDHRPPTSCKPFAVGGRWSVVTHWRGAPGCDHTRGAAGGLLPGADVLDAASSRTGAARSSIEQARIIRRAPNPAPAAGRARAWRAHAGAGRADNSGLFQRLQLPLLAAGPACRARIALSRSARRSASRPSACRTTGRKHRPRWCGLRA